MCLKISCRVLSTFADATKEDVDKAVEAAWVAFKTWKNTTPQERSKILLEIADAIDKNTEKLAKIESMDNGKPIRETMIVDIKVQLKNLDISLLVLLQMKVQRMF